MEAFELSILKKRNITAGFVHLITGIIVIIFYAITKGAHGRANFEAFRNTPATADDASVTRMCSTQTGTFDLPSQCQTTINFTKPVKVASFNVVYGSIAFFFITALAHFFYGTDGFGSGSYSNAITQGWNPYRWFEYASSASLMTVLIGLTDGNRDATSLWALYIMTAAMMFNGYTVESLLRGKAKIADAARDSIRSSTIAGWTLFIGIWVALFYSFATLVSDVKTKFSAEVDPDTGDAIRVPTWIWIIVILQLVYYALFGFIQLKHIYSRLSNKPFDFTKIESSYITLSYVAKVSLAAGIGYGLIFRTRGCPELT